ncbi:MAG: NUDIX domain-containing protein [Candidatus Aenigmarchaeota archaeon]|nr:NUDIX domain-containing protein [Candidatus Aenigmarchaeota archaeon]
MVNRNISVTLECFIKKGNKYLMLHRNSSKKIIPDVWMAPGGHREFNEGLFECAKREILEETGLKIKNIHIKATGCAHLKDLNKEIFFHLLKADYAGGELKENMNDGKLAWHTPEEILNLDNLLSELREILPYIFSEEKKITSYKAVYEKGNKMIQFEIENADGEF